jgi:hypothetical protein
MKSGALPVNVFCILSLRHHHDFDRALVMKQPQVATINLANDGSHPPGAQELWLIFKAAYRGGLARCRDGLVHGYTIVGHE